MTALAEKPTPGTIAETPTPPTQSRRKTLFGTGVGNALEWFDWGVFAIFTPFFATQFFDPGDPVSAFLATLIVFAVGFAARPIGGLLFGYLADRRGRKFSMSVTVGAAAAGSLVIACSPTFESVGVLASVLLVLARLVQGLAHGGEMPSAQTYLSECAPAERRGLWASLIYVSGTLGNVIAVIVGAVLVGVLDNSQMVAWGWRIPFAIGGLFGLYALVMRSSMHESDVFETTERVRIWPEIIRHRRQALQVIGLTVGLTVTFYVWGIAAPAHAIHDLGVDPAHALWAGVVANVVFIASLPLWGILSDRIGRKPVLLFSAVSLALAAFPVSAFLGDSAVRLAVAMSVTLVLLGGSAAILPAVFAEMFPTNIRTVGVGIPYSVAVALFGGTAPYLQSWFGTHYGASAFTTYVVVLLGVSVAVICTVPETRAKDLAESD
ncbi:MFS transporter [Nocardioides sp. Root151]|uniref:MFS transporter n=1 Tax=Nocardioides sp. Root151 TaxID=1736475 RepID=UPI0009E67C8D|nr:MFS transporter [Nocardioides sp. Root151]